MFVVLSSFDLDQDGVKGGKLAWSEHSSDHTTEVWPPKHAVPDSREA